MAPGAVSTLLAIDKQHAAKKRRIVSQAFSDNALRDSEPYVLANVRDLVDKVGGTTKQGLGEKEAAWTEPLDMSRWMSWLGFDTMGDLVFGRPFGTMGLSRRIEKLFVCWLRRRGEIIPWRLRRLCT